MGVLVNWRVMRGKWRTMYKTSRIRLSSHPMHQPEKRNRTVHDYALNGVGGESLLDDSIVELNRILDNAGIVESGFYSSAQRIRESPRLSKIYLICVGVICTSIRSVFLVSRDSAVCAICFPTAIDPFFTL